MSNRRHPRRSELTGWPELGEGQSYAQQPGVAPDRFFTLGVDSIRRATHDSLIEALGDRRRSGVWWTHHLAREGRDLLIASFRDTAMDETQREALNLYLERLRNPRALLVTAWCIAEVQS